MPGATDREGADARERRRAAVLAGHEGDVGTARELLGDDDPGVRSSALRALARAGALTAAEVAGAALDATPSVRRGAAEVLGATGCPIPLDDPDPPRLLARLLGDDDATVVEVAAWATGEWLGRRSASGADHGHPELVTTMAELARTHDDALCREAAVAALGAIGDPDGLPAILAATDDKATVRRRAVIALAPFEGEAVDAALERALDDRDWQVRQAAEDLLDVDATAGGDDDADDADAGHEPPAG